MIYIYVAGKKVRWIRLLAYCQLALCFTIINSVSIAQSSGGIRYTRAPTIPFEWDDPAWISRTITDSLSGKTIEQFSTTDGIPIFYSQDIATSVCFDNQCRPLLITVYWNITGRYLGFHLPEREFLSRYDHEPFSSTDYELLHELLADPHLPFGNISFEKLVNRSEERSEEIDGISGATSTSLAPYVVKGAAYTTYTLWNIIYGTAKDFVQEITEQEMTAELLALILRSPSSEDRMWGLDKVNGSIELDPQVIDALLKVIAGEEFFVAFTAINEIRPIHLSSELLQIQLFNLYPKINYNLRKSLISKLKEAPMISREVIGMSREILTEMNGEQLGYILELYRQHNVNDDLTYNSVAELLSSDNSFIAQKAYNFLIGVSDKNEALIRKLEKYQQ